MKNECNETSLCCSMVKKMYHYLHAIENSVAPEVDTMLVDFSERDGLSNCNHYISIRHFTNFHTVF